MCVGVCVSVRVCVCVCVCAPHYHTATSSSLHLYAQRLASHNTTTTSLQKRRIHLCHDIRAAISKSAHSNQNKDEEVDVHEKDWTAYRRLPQYLATISSTHGSDSVAVASAVVRSTCCACLLDMSRHVSCVQQIISVMSIILL